MAYILGFFAADGYITVNKRGGQFWSIQIIDKSLLENIKKAIESEHKISIRKMKEREKTLYRLQIGSIEMCDDLRALGFDERKTKSLAVPNIPKKYFSHFIRGYFDGDGNVWAGQIHKDRKKSTNIIQTVFTSCSLTFLSEVSNLLAENGIEKGSLNKGKGNFYRLRYGVKSSLKLYNFMYNDVTQKEHLFLKRKKLIFEKYRSLRS